MAEMQKDPRGANPGGPSKARLRGSDQREDNAQRARRQQVRPEIVRAIGVFAAAYRLDTLKLMQEIGLHWPDASAAEVAAGMQAGRDYMKAGDDE